MSGQKYNFNLDDKDLAIVGLVLLGVVYSIGAFVIRMDPADVLFAIVTGVAGLAIGRKKE